MKTSTRHFNGLWHWVCICGALIVLAGCGQPIQITNRTPRPSGTRLVATQAAQLQTTAVPTVAAQTDGVTATSMRADATVIAVETPSVAPAITVVITPVMRATPTGDERWAAFVKSRSPYDAPQRMQALAPTALLWLDPLNGQVLEIGDLNGEFVATAQLVLASNGQAAYEVDYVINQDFGLTSISRALIKRMNDAGYVASVRAFVPASDNIVPAP